MRCSRETTEAEVTAKRHALGVRPVYKRIDTCAAEFASPTAYMYSTYESPFAGALADESAPSDKKKVIILGGGPNRIGQGIEFDYCCCHACFALHDAGYETIMVNCNPETVSTDYDTADRLYFEPLTAEDVLEIIATERTNGTLHGVIVQFGGQTPLKLARALEAAEVPILGTSPDAIDLAEDRDRFKRVLDKLRLKQPKNGIAYSVEQARLVAADLGLPLVVRPSYVLGGRAMQIIREENQLSDYLLGTLPELVPADVKARYPNDKTGQINTVLGKNPLLFDRYLSDATEIDVDCLCDGKDTFIVGIMEHIEEAGIHSGDSRLLAAAALARCQDDRGAGAADPRARARPRRRRPDERAIRHQGRRDLRARSQSARLAHGAVRRQGGRHAGREDRRAHHGRREARRLQAEEGRASSMSASRNRCFRSPASPASTPCSARRCARPARSWASTAPSRWPSPRASSAAARGCRARARCSSRCARATRRASPRPCASCIRSASRCWRPRARQRFLTDQGIPTEKVNKVLEGRPHIVDAITNGDVQLVFNTTEGPQALADSRSLRRAALLHKVPYYTTLSGAVAAAQGIRAYLGGDLEVRTLQSYFSET